jgi:hypothetical protein
MQQRWNIAKTKRTLKFEGSLICYLKLVTPRRVELLLSG